MKKFTRELRREMEHDRLIIQQRNNSKLKKRTPEQREQAVTDKKNHYNKKWTGLLNKSETVAQKNHCKWMLEFIDTHTRA